MTSAVEGANKEHSSKTFSTLTKVHNFAQAGKKFRKRN